MAVSKKDRDQAEKMIDVGLELVQWGQQILAGGETRADDEKVQFRIYTIANRVAQRAYYRRRRLVDPSFADHKREMRKAQKARRDAQYEEDAEKALRAALERAGIHDFFQP